MTQLRKLLACDQVAAVCYRIGHNGIEFLLVRTRGGRWTFPKGGVEPGLTHAQVAALEAFEEAGVHGRIEEVSFTRYLRHKRGRRRAGSARRSDEREVTVSAHLCRVLRLGSPQESKRNPTWFSAEQAKERLREDRRRKDGAELARVVDRALARVQWLHQEEVRSGNASDSVSWQADGAQKDALQKVQFEAFEAVHAMTRASEASFVRYLRGQGGTLSRPTEIDVAVKAYLCKVRQVGGNGTGTDQQPKVRVIDSPRGAIVKSNPPGQRSRLVRTGLSRPDSTR
jgi:8-oxo-dGTP pyrophosphatase MutT (NUDIX family)